MNINQLEYFVATVRQKSYSVAAKTLFITPQAVSKAVGDLEKELQIDLLTRSGKEVVPTQFGELFYDRAIELIASFDDINVFVNHHEEKMKYEGKLTLALGSSTFRGTALRESNFDNFNTLYPKIKLSLLFYESGTCLSALEESIVDAAVILGRTQKKGLTCVKLFSATPLIALSKKHPLSKQKSIRLEDLAQSPLALPSDLRYGYRLITKQVSIHGLIPHYVAIPSFLHEHQKFLDSDCGVMFVIDDPSLKELYPGVVYRPLCEDEKFTIPVCLTYRDIKKNQSLLCLERYMLRSKEQFSPTKRLVSEKS